MYLMVSSMVVIYFICFQGFWECQKLPEYSPDLYKPFSGPSDFTNRWLGGEFNQKIVSFRFVLARARVRAVWWPSGVRTQTRGPTLFSVAFALPSFPFPIVSQQSLFLFLLWVEVNSKRD